MANFNLVIDSKFRPFSYDEMIKPVNALYEAHTKVEEGLAELQAKSGMWERLANEQSDPDTYRQYKTYANDLANAAADLALNGINASSRQGLYNMKARYATDITPIEQWYERRMKQADKQEELRAANPDLIFDREAATTSLDEYKKNPLLSYKAINGEAVRLRVLQEAAFLGKEENRSELRRLLDNNQDYWEYVQRNGFSSDAIINAISRSKDANSKLIELMDRAVKSTGVYDWKNPDGTPNTQAIERVQSYAAEGLWGGIGEAKRQIVEDWRTKLGVEQAFTAEQNRLNRALQRELTQLQLEGPSIQLEDGSTYYINSKVLKTKDGGFVQYSSDGSGISYNASKNGAIEQVNNSPQNAAKLAEEFSKLPVAKGTTVTNADAYNAVNMEELLTKFKPVFTLYSSVRNYPFMNSTLNWTAATEGQDIENTFLGSTNLKTKSGGNISMTTGNPKVNITYLPYVPNGKYKEFSTQENIPAPAKVLLENVSKELNVSEDVASKLVMFEVDYGNSHRQYIVAAPKDTNISIPEINLTHSYDLDGSGTEARYNFNYKIADDNAANIYKTYYNKDAKSIKVGTSVPVKVDLSGAFIPGLTPTTVIKR